MNKISDTLGSSSNWNNLIGPISRIIKHTLSVDIRTRSTVYSSTKHAFRATERNVTIFAWDEIKKLGK